MPLYSTDIQSKATGQHYDADNNKESAEREVLLDSGVTSWCYLFVHHAKLNLIERLLNKKFKTFIHKTTVYKKERKQVRKKDKPTISGLIFIQGDKVEIQEFLNRNCHGIYLANDCSTKTTAVIPDEIMRPFMQLDLGCNRVRFMPHPLNYYSDGHYLIRITSGLLTGFEGYIIRISRNKCLVTSIGGITVAINGINKDSFENVDEYVRQRLGLALTNTSDCVDNPYLKRVVSSQTNHEKR